MKVELKANGKTVQVEMTEEQLKELGVIKPRTGYERRKEWSNEYYYLVDADSEVKRIKENGNILDQDCYDTGNYYSDKTVAENNARADMLFRCLRQWQAAHDQTISISDWKNDKINKYCIAYGYGAKKLYVDHYYSIRLPNTIHFTTEEKAEEAIEVFKDELLWYFTEYVQRLDEVQCNG